MTSSELGNWLSTACAFSVPPIYKYNTIPQKHFPQSPGFYSSTILFSILFSGGGGKVLRHKQRIEFAVGGRGAG